MENEDDQSDYEIAYEGDNEDHEEAFHANSRSLTSENKRNTR